MAHGIVVPFDGSALSRQALPYAELLARHFDAPLTLVEAIEPVVHGKETAAQAQVRCWEEAVARLDALREELTGRGLAVEVLLEVGRPAQVIREVAAVREAALIVMATHGRGGPSHLVLGSVAEQVVRATHLPVLLLPPAALRPPGGAERLLRRLVVPYDGSDLSASIFPVVQTLAAGLHAPVTLLRAVDPAGFISYAGVYTLGTMTRPDLFEEAVAAHRQELAREAERWRQGGVVAEAAVERGGPRAVIPDYAEAVQAGWIAMASHGRGELGDLLLGSVALHVLRHSAVPVLIAARPPIAPYRLGTARRAARPLTPAAR